MMLGVPTQEKLTYLYKKEKIKTMLYAKIKNGLIEKFPYTIQNLREDYPNVSFPAKPARDILAEYNMVEIAQEEMPLFDPFTQYVVSSNEPVYVGDRWVMGKSVIDKTPEQVAQQVKGASTGMVSKAWTSALEAGYDNGEFVMQCDKQDYEMMNDGLSLFLVTSVDQGGAGGLDQTTTIVRDKNNIGHEMTIEAALNLALEMKIYYWRLWSRKGMYRDALNACTTREEMDLVVF
jgi:hypothetical protein